MGDKTCELLAPAGNPEMLHAAISGGADAAYLGLQSFNARRNAKNFDFDSFGDACEYAHLRGAKLYVAMNTIVFEDELKDAIYAAFCAHDIGADAFIIQDIGLAYALKSKIPNARMHASTQMSIHSIEGLRMAKELGFSRVTLAREMSLGEIEAMCNEAIALDIEIETFAHGALCISYSGQCLMSSMIGCRSANRGLCAQPCRLEYDLVDLRDSSKAIRTCGSHLLSPKDLCAVDDVSALVRMGVSSLKIEGRMKSPEYAFATVSVYREKLDDALSDSRKCEPSSQCDFDSRDKLESVFSRGFSRSYLEGNRGNSMMSYKRPNNRGQFMGRVKSIAGDVIEVALEGELKRGDVCEVWTRRGNMIVEVEQESILKAGVLSFKLDSARSRKDPYKGMSYAPSKGDRVFRIRSIDAQVDIGDMDPRISVDGRIFANEGSPLEISFSVVDANDAVSRRLMNRLGENVVSANAKGAIVEPARTKSITEEEIFSHVNRMGQTPFKLRHLDIDLDAGVGMGFSQIHRIRANALEILRGKLLEALGYGEKAGICNGKTDTDASPHLSHVMCSPKEDDILPNAHISRGSTTSSGSGQLAESDISVCVYVSNPECARVAKRNGADKIYVGALNYRRKMSQKCGVAEIETERAGYPKRCTQVIGPISHNANGQSREAVLQTDAWACVREGSSVLVESLDGIRRALDLSCQLEIGPQFPIVNHASFDIARAFGANKIWLSSELSLAQMEALSNALDGYCADDIELGIFISGAQELMTCEHCILMGIGDCDGNCPSCARRKVPFALRDKMGYEFPIVTDYLGRSHLFNSLNTDNMNSIPRLLDIGVRSFMINAQLMDLEQTAQETSRLCASISKAISGDGQIEKRKGTTTGHLHRPVA